MTYTLSLPVQTSQKDWKPMMSTFQWTAKAALFIECWFSSLKYEGIYLKNYEHVLALKAGVQRYVAFYNEKRYHYIIYFGISS